MIDYLETAKPNLTKNIKDLFNLTKIKFETKDYIEVKFFDEIKLKFEENFLNLLKEKIREIKTEESELIVYYDGGCNVKSNSLVKLNFNTLK